MPVPYTDGLNSVSPTCRVLSDVPTMPLRLCRALFVFLAIVPWSPIYRPWLLRGNWEPLATAQSAETMPGLVAHITLPDGSNVARVDPICDWQWNNPHEYDQRLSIIQATNHIVWRGAVDVKASGKYQLALFASGGNVTVSLDGQPLLSGRTVQPELLKGPEQELSLGYHAIEIDYSGSEPAGQAKLVWRGPGFQWEPLNERYLTHAADQHPGDQFERGQLLARGLRCDACHGTGPNELAATPLAAPDLTALKGNLDRDWLVKWLVSDSSKSTASDELRDDEVVRRMPHFAMSGQDAFDIAEALLKGSSNADKFQPSRDYESKENKPKGKDKKAARTKPDAAEGRTILLTRGCIACHALSSDEIGVRDEDDEAVYAAEARRDYLIYQLFSGGELSGIAAKRPSDFFSRWLAKPESISATHRMPQASLTDLERDDVSLYLSSLQPKEAIEAPSLKGDAQRGAKLLVNHRCGACHTLPKTLTSPPVRKTPLDKSSRWDTGCLTSADATKSIPGFQLTEGQRQALKNYWTSVVGPKANNGNNDGSNGVDKASRRNSADLLLAESNCFGCHARQNHVGLMPRAMQVISKQRDLAARLPAMLPPSLNGVGDKLHEAALAESIARNSAPHRPWLDVRMPKYPFSPEQVKSLVDSLVARDRLPTLEQVDKQPLPDDVVTRSAAGRLVTSDGFGCQSCHQIGDQPSPTVALGARGTDLTMLGKRIRQSWFDRWVRNSCPHRAAHGDAGYSIARTWRLGQRRQSTTGCRLGHAEHA